MRQENFYTLCIKLLEHRNSYFDSDFNDASTMSYFSKSLEDIHSFLQFKYGDSYLFSSIAYSVEQRVKALPYRFNFGESDSEINHDTKQYVISLINYLTQNLINEESHLSFTQVMLSEKNQKTPIKILLFEGKNSEETKEYKPIDIVEFDLGKVKWEKIGDIEKFKVHDFVGYQYGVPLHEEFINSFGNPLKAMAGDTPSSEVLEEFNRLISIYLEINDCFGGANYFYFIKPQSTHNVFSGVLLLGLKKRIPIDEFTLWVHVFHRQLSEISVKQIQQLAATNENAQATSHFGHLLRYRLSPPGQYIELIGKAVEKLKDILSTENKSIIDSLEKYYRGANIWFQKTMNTGFLLNIRAHYFKNPDAGHKVFNERTVWRQNISFDLLGSLDSLLNELNENKIKIHTEREFAPFKLVKGCSRVSIETWFQHEDKSYRPFDILYEDLLFEILINAFKASPKNDEIEIKVFEVKINERDALVIANKIDEHILRINSRKYNSIKGNWKIFKDFSGSIGGLTYWSQLIDVTGVGKVFIRTNENNGATFFETGLLLQGLKF